MAVAMDVAWASDSSKLVSHACANKSWGEDEQKLLQLLTGYQSRESDQSSHTLDLLGSSSSNSAHASSLELDLELLPLPIGWERRLDLKSGEIYYLNWHSGERTYNDPRKMRINMDKSVVFGSRKQGTEKSNKGVNFELLKREEDNLDLKLNLSTCKVEKVQEFGVTESTCTVEKVQEALQRSGQGKKRSRPTSNLILPSKVDQQSAMLSPSSSSSSSSRSSLSIGGGAQTLQPHDASTVPDFNSKVSEENRVILTGCKRCLMYVMISYADPKCPKCSHNLVPDFSMPQAKKSNISLGL